MSFLLWSFMIHDYHNLNPTRSYQITLSYMIILLMNRMSQWCLIHIHYYPLLSIIPLPHNYECQLSHEGPTQNLTIDETTVFEKKVHLGSVLPVGMALDKSKRISKQYHPRWDRHLYQHGRYSVVRASKGMHRDRGLIVQSKILWSIEAQSSPTKMTVARPVVAIQNIIQRT